MSTQSMRSLTAQGHDGNPRYVIQNRLDGLPEIGDSSLIRGDAPASAKRLVKNVFDAYGIGKEGCFASSIGELVRLVEVSAKGYHQCLEPTGPKERLEASTVAEVTISPGASRRRMRPQLAYTCGNGRDAQRSRDPTRRMCCLSDRHVRSTCQSFLGNDRGTDLRFEFQQLLQYSSRRTWSCSGKERARSNPKHEHQLSCSSLSVGIFLLSLSLSHRILFCLRNCAILIDMCALRIL